MTEQDTVEIATLLHHRWAETMRMLDAVRKETDDGSPDWAGFHEDRLSAAVAEEAQWRGIKDRYTGENRTVIMRSMGFDS